MGILFSHCCGNVQKKAKQEIIDDTKDVIVVLDDWSPNRNYQLSTIQLSMIQFRIQIVYDRCVDDSLGRQLWIQYLHIEESELSKPIRKIEYKAAVNVIEKTHEVRIHNVI